MTPPSSSVRNAFLTIAVSVIAAVAAAGGFVAGRSTVHDAYVQKVRTLITTENTMKTLYSALGPQLDDPVTAEGLAKLYGVRAGDRDALAQRLRGVAWVPAHRPAPFVGQLARPLLGDDPHINVLGFRDERQTYGTKAARTVRIFLTGGSTAWGSGAPSQKSTISYQLERLLNERVSRRTGFRYEVVNTAFPAWTTTQEKLLIAQRLVDMHPDVILMFSGNNDVHWSRDGRDIRWFDTPMDENQLLLLNELYRSSGHPEWTVAAPAQSVPTLCPGLARITARNVDEAAAAAGAVHARLIFALQPNVATSAKQLTEREQRLPEAHNRPYWESCYAALRAALGGIHAPNYRLLDLSRSFAGVDGSTELFVDSYHLAELGNRLVAEELAAKIAWPEIAPGAAVAADPAEALTIVSVQSDGGMVRIVPNRFDKNLLVVVDKELLPTVVAADAITATLPAALSPGEHAVSVVDGMTGAASPPVALHAR
jgi:lysophospholipase L1-like esterase